MTKPKTQQSRWRNRIVGEAEIAPDQLLANPLNWRIHPHEQELALRGVLDEVGWVQRVIVNKNTGHVVDGHMRVATAISQNEPTVPVLYVDLTEDEEKKILLTIDPLSAMAVMDDEKFRELVSEVEFACADAMKSVEAAADAAGHDLTGASDVDISTADIATLKDKFIVPPFSVLDARQGYWQERKRAWIALGIQSELGRGADIVPNGSTRPPEQDGCYMRTARKKV